jgi:hypothetical protein
MKTTPGVSEDLVSCARYWGRQHDIASNRQDTVRGVLKACADRIEELERGTKTEGRVWHGITRDGQYIDVRKRKHV